MSRAKEKSNRRKQPFFIVACLLAFAVHAWGIYLLNEVGLQIHTFSGPQSKQLGRLERREWQEKKNEALKRNEDLVKAFEQLKSTLNIPDELSIAISELKSIPVDDMKVEDIQSDEDLNLLSLLDSSSEEDTQHILAEITTSSQIDSLLNREIPQILPPLDSLAVVYNGESQASEEIIEATRRLLGESQPLKNEEIKNEFGISVGLAEDSSIEGRSFQERSGLLDSSDLILDKAAEELSNVAQDREYFASLQALKQVNEEWIQGVKVGKGSIILQTVSLFDEELLDEPLAINELSSVASSDDFYLDVQFSKAKDKNGYLFKVAFYPQNQVNFKRIKQNMFFLIDRSHSINRKRYRYAKEAVMDALKFMHPGDTFNILVFDNEVTSLSPKSLVWNHSNLLKARDFLANQKHGGLFASTELYSSLDQIIPDVVAENEVNTAVLLSDGDTFLRREQKRSMIANWTLQNKGKISLYSLASGQGNNLALLEVITAFNKGFLLYTPEDSETKIALSHMVRAIRNPIGKDIKATTVPGDKSQIIQLYPSDTRLPDLYENLPYILVGYTNSLDSFHIFLQGRYYDRWLDIKQKVDFSQAKEVTGEIEADYVVQEVFTLYEQYLHDGDYNHVEIAKEKLAPLDLPIAFE